MKKILSVHVLTIIGVILTFLALMIFANKSDAANTYAERQRLKSVRRTVNKQLEQDKRERIQQRRQQIQYNGNINNFYPRAFKVRWIIINNRAYLMFSHYHPYYGYYNRYMRIT